MADDVSPFPGKPLGGGYYEVSAEEMKDWTIFRPGIPDYDGPMDDLPTETIDRATSFNLMDIIIFNDWLSPHPMDDLGCNQWAFVVSDREALFVRGRVHSIDLSLAHKLDNPIVIHRFPYELAKLLVPALVSFRKDPMMFQVVVNHLRCNNLVPVIESRFFPDEVSYADQKEYEEAWQFLLNSLQPRDAIFTFNRQSLISKIIARVTHGPFSHCAVYAGDGIISEVVTSGTRMVNIDIYKGRHNRVAVYRHHGKVPNTVEEMVAEMKAEDGRPGYSYLGALQAGIRAYFGDHSAAMSPNSLILAGALTFIAQA